MNSISFIRNLFLLSLVVSLLTVFLGANPAQAAEKDCGKELNQEYKAFLKKLRAQNFKTGAASGSGKAAKAMTKWLQKVHKEVVAHENAHKKASGKWGGTIKYKNYTWWNIPYAVAGCHIPKHGRPLEVSLKAALAPKEPSKWDLENAKKIRALLKKKKK
ncbi:MAG: hypothetical protein OQK24_04085 [Magnetovibrio sp.]|nr:hypothetical protein [Magnetovibrio sp.]